MNRYSYPGFHKIKVIFIQVVGVFGFFISTFTAIFGLVGIWIVPRHHNSTFIVNDPRLTLICLAVWFVVVGWSISFTMINYFPTIWVDEDELQISAYLFFRKRIPWSSIVDIGSGFPPKGYVLVRVRRITLFHKAYGWLYSRSFYPSFLIERHITDRDNLIKEIAKRIKMNSSQTNE
jgi:hypothetical protein